MPSTTGYERKQYLHVLDKNQAVLHYLLPTILQGWLGRKIARIMDNLQFTKYIPAWKE